MNRYDAMAVVIAMALVGCGDAGGSPSNESPDAGHNEDASPDADADADTNIFEECAHLETSDEWPLCVGEDVAIAEQQRVQEEMARRNNEQVSPDGDDYLEGCDAQSPVHFCTVEPGNYDGVCVWDFGYMGGISSRPVPTCLCDFDFSTIRDDVCGSE